MIADVQTSDTGHRRWVSVFWYGNANRIQGEVIKADLTRSIAWLIDGNTRFLVLSVMNRADEGRGTPAYEAITSLNEELAQLYPNNYLDIRSYMVNQYDPNSPGDVEDFSNDVPPRSLRWDHIHFNNYGYSLIAQRVRTFFSERGW